MQFAATDMNEHLKKQSDIPIMLLAYVSFLKK
jgi:hypothetical protein